MTIDLATLATGPRLLFAIPLAPLQGQRFQPTGFPGLGAATFRSPKGDCLLVESAQSMANWLEATIWDEANSDVVAAVKGISHVRVNRADGSFLTDTILEAHRLSSPYLLAAEDKVFFNRLEETLRGRETGPVDRKKLARALLKLDVGCLLHGVFLAKKELAGGRFRVARALSAFIEADGVRVAPSGGVKNDHVHPGKVKGDSTNLFGNIPYARDEFTAERITLYVNLDLAQIRGYGLGVDVERMLILLALFKLRKLLDGSLRLRTACDLGVAVEKVCATTPSTFELPTNAALETDLKAAINACKSHMEGATSTFANKLESAKEEEGPESGHGDDANQNGD